MREIEFRGKSVVTGQWIYGSLINATPQGAAVIYDDEQIIHPVDPETVGQYTSLLDIKGKEIYHDDLLKDEENFIWKVIYKHGAFYAQCEDLMAEQLLSSINLYCYVISNVHDNPELVEAS